VLNASTSREINAAFTTFVRERPDALYVGTGPFFVSRRVQLTHLATRHAVPAIYSGRQYTDAGGLMSYGTSLTDAYRQMGVYTGRRYIDALQLTIGDIVSPLWTGVILVAANPRRVLPT